MQRILLISFFFFLATGLTSKLPPPVLMGILTNHDYSVEELIKDIFIKGDCQNVSNIKAIGNNLSIGYFEGGSSVFGFSNGIILSSGDVALAEGPNVSVESGAQFNDNTGDPDINLFATGAAFDVAGIEFDFVPIGETVTFRYVFASEEYCEFVGSIFNDVFGFFVSGPGINGSFSNNAINVALIPGTSDYVAINSVNHNDNSGYYMGNELQMDATSCGISFQPNFLEEIGYDGLTVPFTATIPVTPCETYHIRILVADIGDDKLDSGVFLQSQSFDMSGSVSVMAQVPGSTEPIAVEDCLDGQFVFTRTGTNLNEPLTVFFTIDPSSTAENGADFLPIPDSIIIPAGQVSAILPILVLADGVGEMQEMLTISLNLPCDCEDPFSATLFIDDDAEMEVENAEIETCAGQELTISPTILSGAAPFTYLWQDGSTNPTLTTSVDQPTEFSVTITDACGASQPAIILVNTLPAPEAHISGSVTLCPTEPDFLEIALGGSPPWSIIYSINSVERPAISGIQTTPFVLHPTQPGEYTLTHFSDAYCEGTGNGVGTVQSPLDGCKPYTMFVPNAFSPNDDGFNDEFRFFPAENSNIAEVKSLHIFNRWGAIIFERNNFQPDADMPLWKGQFKGKLMDAGVFVWQAVLLLEDGEEVVASGDLVLVR